MKRLPRAATRLVIFGSSQAGVIFSGGARDGRTYILAQPSGGAPELLSLVPLLGRGPGTVVILIAPLDTFGGRPIEARRQAGTLAIVRALAREEGRAAFWVNRRERLRMLVSVMIHAYDTRFVLQAAGLDASRRFTPLPVQPPVRSRVPPPSAMEASILARFPSEAQAPVTAQAWQIRNLRTGEPARINLRLLATAVDALRVAGWRVVIAEPPLNPLARPLYDAAREDEFRGFVRGLEQSERIARFIPTDGLPGDKPEDFRDLTHLTPEAGVRFRRALLPLVASGASIDEQK